MLFRSRSSSHSSGRHPHRLPGVGMSLGDVVIRRPHTFQRTWVRQLVALDIGQQQSRLPSLGVGLVKAVGHVNSVDGAGDLCQLSSVSGEQHFLH